jgi:hypothetical protein
MKTMEKKATVTQINGTKVHGYADDKKQIMEVEI